MDITLDGSELIINVRVGAEIEKIHLKDDLVINEKALSSEFIKQPSLFAWYSALLADQEGKLSRAKIDMESTKAGIVLRLRQGKRKIMGAGGSAVKVTDSVQDSYVLEDKLFKQYQETVQELEVIVKKLKVLKDASLQRKDMLMQLGALHRAEMEQFKAFPGGSGEKQT
jgi:hypothetical protein